jgi:hypothetical protein
MGGLGFYHFSIRALHFNNLAFRQEREEFDEKCREILRQIDKNNKNKE